MPMADVVELSAAECERLLRTHDVGRLAVCTPGGPHVFPVNFAVLDDSTGPAIVIRTAAYSELGRSAAGSTVAFEVDELEPETRTGWSVEARGPAELVDRLSDLSTLTDAELPRPWAAGYRSMFLQLRWTEITGRRLLARS